MSIVEFLNFKKEAMKAHITFFCHIMAGGVYYVEADRQFLE